MGARGARAWWRHGTVALPAPRVTAADTVGAGDAFTAALLSGLLAAGPLGAGGAPRAALAAATAGPDLAAPVLNALTLAARAAAMTCTREGADPPTAAQLAP
ncbi:PfkB family carbohydrate kinase [Streptomyces sp. V4-01]|uniref:PfkB family carbohydrate kinase n=1 Tax=Actinacidiphila polyblastidii TaxID=3110430 RepID=A0ABU7PLA0_9ACTN|nr:PfkB family carbohydrate kinase [Streptomyces sp. V4-01]